MGNPYGITEVDVPGALAAYQNNQDRRVQRLLATRQDTREQAEFDRGERVANAWAKFSQRGQGGVQGAASAYGQEATPQGAAPPQQAPQPDYDPWQDDAAQQELLSTLTALDPQQAMQVRTAMRQSSKEERDHAAESWSSIGNAAFQLRQMPPADRPAALQRQLPILQSLGVPQELLSQIDLTDAGLESYVTHARDLEAVIRGSTPTVMEEQAGSTLRPVTPGSPYPNFGPAPSPVPQTAVVQNEADLLDAQAYQGGVNTLGPEGAANLLVHRGGAVRVSTPDEARTLPPGTPILLPDGTRGVVPGGPASAPGGFR